jgi:hypothetical protein
MRRKVIYQSPVRNLQSKVCKHESITKSVVLYPLNVTYRYNMCDSSVLRREFGSKWRKWQENGEISPRNCVIFNIRYSVFVSTYRVHLSYRPGSRCIPTADPNCHIPCTLPIYSNRKFPITLNLKIFSDCIAKHWPSITCLHDVTAQKTSVRIHNLYCPSLLTNQPTN